MPLLCAAAGRRSTILTHCSRLPIPCWHTIVPPHWRGWGWIRTWAFLHRLRPGRRSLALDLMEELRPVFADRFVLSCVNQKRLTAKHLHKQENGAVLLTDEGRREFLSAWQTRKQEPITHPFLGEKAALGSGSSRTGASSGPHAAWGISIRTHRFFGNKKQANGICRTDAGKQEGRDAGFSHV